ncbi:MAG TPA: hypothetical protein VJW20_07260 [Candidatus Angelobacter sp.]|nr:hypothetical protein [Candidatus Angelobacter sp.]
MKKELTPISNAMMAVLQDPRASRIERIECAKVLLSCYGCLIPDVDERWLSVRQIVQLRRIKQELVERVLHQKEVRRKQNRRALLRRKIRKLKQQQETSDNIN